MRFAACLLLVLTALCGAAGTSYAQRRECLDPGKTLEAIAQNRLVRPGDALSTAAVSNKGEALSAKLCRWDNGFRYEITVMRRDGKVVRAYVDAASGLPVDP